MSHLDVMPLPAKRLESDSDTDWFASRRSRFFAFLIDSLILGLVGSGILYLATEQVIEMGWTARLIGLVIGCAYFGVQESGLGAGQSLGKRALGISVVTGKGRYLSPIAAASRYAILMIPHLCNHVSPDPDTFGIVLLNLALLGLVGVGGLLVYLFLFNRGTRQWAHDLVTNAYVVRTGEVRSDFPALASVHKYVAIAWLVLCLGGVGVLRVTSNSAMGSAEFANFLEIRSTVRQMTGADLTFLGTGATTIKSSKAGTRTREYFSAKLRVAKQPEDYGRLAARIAVILLEKDIRASEKEVVKVHLNYGATVLISSFNINRNFVHTPEEWMALQDQ